VNAALALPGAGPRPSRPPTPANPWAAIGSALLHGLLLAALFGWLAIDPAPEVKPEDGVSVVWEEVPDQEDSLNTGEPPPPPPAPVLAEQPTPPAPEAAAPPPQPPPPAPPPRAVAEAPQTAPPPAPLAADLPPPPPLARESVTLPPPAPEAPAEQKQQEAAAPTVEEDLPLPPPAPPAPPPREKPPEKPPERPPEKAPPKPAAPAAPRAAPPARAAAPVTGPATNAPPPPLFGQGTQPLVVPGAARVIGAVSPPGLLPGVRNPEPEYPLASRQRGEAGEVGVVIQVGESGQAVGVQVSQSSGYPALDESARRAVMRWRFKPAMRDGVPVPGTIRTRVHFRLN
jgi:TonB family protein